MNGTKRSFDLKRAGLLGLLAGLSLLLTACPGFVPYNSAYVGVLYDAKDVCQGVMITNHMEESKWTEWTIERISRDENGESHFVKVTLPPGETVRIPDPW